MGVGAPPPLSTSDGRVIAAPVGPPHQPLRQKPRANVAADKLSSPFTSLKDDGVPRRATREGDRRKTVRL